MRNIFFKRSLVLSVVICTLAACNSGSDKTQETNAPAIAEAKSALPKTDTVIIEEMKFNPAELTINKGDTVLFINRDIVQHNATQIDSAWASPNLSTGDSWSIVPDKSADYFCSLHVVMKGRIVVP